MLIELNDTIVSAEIFKRKFVCDLTACKGACCIEGDAGAPLTTEEVYQIENQLTHIIPFMRKEGIEAVNKNGISYLDQENEPVTMLVDGKECAFVFFDAKQTALCAIEAAHRAGKIENIKPISCSLYPIRVKQYHDFKALQYDEWKICESACSCGDKLNVPVYKFLKEPLIRAFGEAYYQELELVAPEIEQIEP
jgi:Fe-S-cluster containining protein